MEVECRDVNLESKSSKNLMFGHILIFYKTARPREDQCGGILVIFSSKMPKRKISSEQSLMIVLGVTFDPVFPFDDMPQKELI
jgi:hypothetical protein